MARFKEFIAECRRVLLVTKRPTREEFKVTVKVSALGIGVLGLIGFIISIIAQIIRG